MVTVLGHMRLQAWGTHTVAGLLRRVASLYTGCCRCRHGRLQEARPSVEAEAVVSQLGLRQPQQPRGRVGEGGVAAAHRSQGRREVRLARYA